MKILHLHNISGVPFTLSRAQRRQGMTSDVVVFRKHPLGFGYDFNIDVDRYPRMVQPLVRLNALMRRFRGYDVYHMHSASFLPAYCDAPLLKAMGKTVVYHHWGSDLRGKSPAFLSRVRDLRFVGTPDLLEFAPDATWVGYPIDRSIWKPVVSKTSKIVNVVHAPTNRSVKGTEHVVRAIESLRETGYPVRLKLVEGLAAKDVMREYMGADIVVDQLLIGFYGTLAAESMALGKPVCAYIRDDLRKFIPGCPVVNVTPETLEARLESLVKDKALRTRLGKAGPKYIEKVHDADLIARRTIQAYEQVRR